MLEGLLTVGELGVAVAADLLDIDDVERLRVPGDLIDGVLLDGLTLRECLLDQPIGEELSVRSARMLQVRIDRPQIVALMGANAQLSDAELAGGRMASLDLHGARLMSVALIGVRIGYVNLRGATLCDVVVEDCTIDTLDMPEATASRVRFDGSTVKDFDLRGARLSDVDLRGLQIGSISGVEALRGSWISPLQLELLAPALARAMGIAVEG